MYSRITIIILSIFGIASYIPFYTIIKLAIIILYMVFGIKSIDGTAVVKTQDNIIADIKDNTVEEKPEIKIITGNEKDEENNAAEENTIEEDTENKE